MTEALDELVVLGVGVAAAVAPPSIAVTALLGPVPMVLAAAAVALFGVETRRRLEEIAAATLGSAR